MQPTVVGVDKVGVGRDGDTSDKVVLDEEEAVQDLTLLPEGKWSERQGLSTASIILDVSNE
jgi:hypothetical protein